MNNGAKNNKLLLEIDTSQDNSAFVDDNLSENDRIIRIGGQSEYSMDQSMLSIR